VASDSPRTLLCSIGPAQLDLNFNSHTRSLAQPMPWRHANGSNFSLVGIVTCVCGDVGEVQGNCLRAGSIDTCALGFSYCQDMPYLFSTANAQETCKWCLIPTGGNCYLGVCGVVCEGQGRRGRRLCLYQMGKGNKRVVPWACIRNRAGRRNLFRICRIPQ